MSTQPAEFKMKPGEKRWRWIQVAVIIGSLVSAAPTLRHQHGFALWCVSAVVFLAIVVPDRPAQ